MGLRLVASEKEPWKALQSPWTTIGKLEKCKSDYCKLEGEEWARNDDNTLDLYNPYLVLEAL
ncbi:hypothetical protein AXX17_AT3G05070 [Arabidopsis thaliana]|uniref:Uncharacterized protein n=1 Tax=Arabidopsis thaliana TaxID=3702 RepID=A0A178V8X5_ARATH|nr:hypothetical protein AXX17_AT3G05070 [Arabidopsis thaliana]